uniref:Uncharacterized protein n=1 Tax=Ditylenchus dipsaci TaxID=166011 RepID=A0A915CNB3_9BILA
MALPPLFRTPPPLAIETVQPGPQKKDSFQNNSFSGFSSNENSQRQRNFSGHQQQGRNGGHARRDSETAWTPPTSNRGFQPPVTSGFQANPAISGFQAKPPIVGGQGIHGPPPTIQTHFETTPVSRAFQTPSPVARGFQGPVPLRGIQTGPPAVRVDYSLYSEVTPSTSSSTSQPPSTIQPLQELSPSPRSSRWDQKGGQKQKPQQVAQIPQLVSLPQLVKPQMTTFHSFMAAKLKEPESGSGSAVFNPSVLPPVVEIPLPPAVVEAEKSKETETMMIWMLTWMWTDHLLHLAMPFNLGWVRNTNTQHIQV